MGEGAEGRGSESEVELVRGIVDSGQRVIRWLFCFSAKPDSASAAEAKYSWSVWHD